MFFLSKKPIDYYNLEYFWIKVLYLGRRYKKILKFVFSPNLVEMVLQNGPLETYYI